MIASGVAYAKELNLAAKTFGVDQALLQSIIDTVKSDRKVFRPTGNMLIGDGEPNPLLGSDGDYYRDFISGDIHGPKVALAPDPWGSPIGNIKGTSTFDSKNVMGLTDEESINYARAYARSKAVASAGNDGGLLDAESNIMAGAWRLAILSKRYPDWLAVKAFFGMNPVGEAKARRIYFEIYPSYRKLWE